MKRVLMIAVMMVFCSTFVVFGATDKQIVERYCKEHYNGYKIVYTKEVPTNRMNKKIVYIQIEKSVSSGKIDKRNNRCWGFIDGSNYYKTWYNKKVRKGKKVTSYYIYNPNTNYEDDIVAVIDNKKIR